MLINNRVEIKGMSGSKGFTLIEVLVAMAIFSIGILAVASMQLAATKGSSSARLSSEAAVLAQSQMESLVALKYDPTLATPINDFDPANSWTHGVTYSNRYTVDWGVTQNTLNGILLPNNCLGITVTVTWPSGGGQKSYSLDFIKSAKI